MDFADQGDFLFVLLASEGVGLAQWWGRRWGGVLLGELRERGRAYAVGGVPFCDARFASEVGTWVSSWCVARGGREEGGGMRGRLTAGSG